MFYSRKLLYAALLALFIWMPIFGAVQSVNSFDQLERSVMALEPGCVVIVDIDEVLITSEDAILRPIGDALRNKIMNEKHYQADSVKSRDEIEAILSIPIKESSKKLVDEMSTHLMQCLQKKGIKVIAMTSYPAGQVGSIESCEALRLFQLARLNLDFSKSFQHPRCFLKALQSPYAKVPIYNQGVIFTEGHSKAEVLESFLKQMNLKPSKIVIVDDLFCNLITVDSKLDHLHIPHHCFYYSKVRQEPKGYLNEKIARFQYDHLFKHQEWLSDKEASKVLGMH